jgi:transposase-like protein
MKINCPTPDCRSHVLSGPKKRPIVRNGFFYRRSDSRKIRRYFCKGCRTYFSNSTLSPLRYQKKRRIHSLFKQLYTSGVTQRRLALVLRVNRKTVVKKIRLFAELERAHQEAFLEETYLKKPLAFVQFDDLETSEHTKCKPLSVSLAVDPETRKILKFKVSSMPAKGHLAHIAFRKYGKRTDERPKGWNELMSELKPYVQPEAEWTSDENPHYPAHLKRHHPRAKHIQVKGGRGAITGQGELKKLKFDPLFALNHTCAMLRANMNRLFRKTWSTTKTQRGLIDHLSLYVSYHNQVLTPPISS